MGNSIMISIGTKLVCADNTDIKKFKCIKIFGNSFKKYAGLGETVRVAIAKRKHKKNIIKKKLYFGLIITVKFKTKRLNGLFIKFDENRALTLNEQNKFLGTRVYGPICKEVRNLKKKKQEFKKIISYSGVTL